MQTFERKDGERMSAEPDFFGSRVQRMLAWQLSHRLPNLASCTGAWQATQSEPMLGGATLPSSWQASHFVFAWPAARLKPG